MGWSSGGVSAWKTWTPVFTGFSTDPVMTAAQYVKIGKTVIAGVDMTGGVSNATFFTMTLPVAAHSTGNQYFPTRAINNNSNQDNPGLLVTRTGSDIADLYQDLQTGVWTASSNKRAYFTITYEVD